MMTGRTQMPSSGNIRDGNAAVHHVLRGVMMEKMADFSNYWDPTYRWS